MECLYQYVINNNTEYTIIFYRYKSIKNIFRRTDKGFCEKKGATKHQFCIRQIVDNLHNTFNSHDLNEKFKAAAYARNTKKKIKATMIDLKDRNGQACWYLMDIEKKNNKGVEEKKEPKRFDLWAINHDGGTNR
jgi:hypothetical protein